MDLFLSDFTEMSTEITQLEIKMNFFSFAWIKTIWAEILVIVLFLSKIHPNSRYSAVSIFLLLKKRKVLIFEDIYKIGEVFYVLQNTIKNQ